MEKCDRIKVRKTCCYIEFGKGEYHVSRDGLETVRGENMIIDFDKNEKVIGIELLSGEKAKKRCGS